MATLNIEKLQQLRELCHIPLLDGEQFIDVDLHLMSGVSGIVRFGFRNKLDFGEQDFRSLDEAIEIVLGLRKKVRAEF